MEAVGLRRDDGEDVVLDGEGAGWQAKSPLILGRESRPLWMFEECTPPLPHRPPRPSMCVGL